MAIIFVQAISEVHSDYVANMLSTELSKVVFLRESIKLRCVACACSFRQAVRFDFDLCKDEDQDYFSTVQV